MMTDTSDSHFISPSNVDLIFVPLSDKPTRSVQKADKGVVNCDTNAGGKLIELICSNDDKDEI